MNKLMSTGPRPGHSLLGEYERGDHDGAGAGGEAGGTILVELGPPGARARDAESQITLGLLDAVQQNARLSQRTLASELGIALGLTNAYLKRCVGKGWIKVRRAPANRYLYYLTPRGFAEKSRLTARYLKASFLFYGAARNELSALIEACVAAGWRRVAFAGAGELAEIALLCAMQYPSLEVVGVLDNDCHDEHFLHVPLAGSPEDLGSVQAIIVTHMREPQAIYNTLVSTFPAERVLVPRLLKVSRRDRNPETHR